MAMAQGWQTNSEPGRKQQPLLHYGSPSRLCYFNLALKGVDAPTRVNAAVLGKKNCPNDCATGKIRAVRGFFFLFFSFPSSIPRSLWQKELARIGSPIKGEILLGMAYKQ